MKALDYLGSHVKVTIDRPIGSKHPTYGFVYPVNYGYVPGTSSPDGEELDAYVLGMTEPISSFEGVCIAVIQRLNDEDPKLVLANPGKSFSNDEIIAMTNFQERFFKSEIVRVDVRRPDSDSRSTRADSFH